MLDVPFPASLESAIDMVGVLSGAKGGLPLAFRIEFDECVGAGRGRGRSSLSDPPRRVDRSLAIADVARCSSQSEPVWGLVFRDRTLTLTQR